LQSLIPPSCGNHERERAPLPSWRDEVTINRMNNAPRRRRAILISDRPENEERTIPDVIDSRWDRKDMLSDFPEEKDIISTTKENTERQMHEALINDRSSNQGNRRFRDNGSGLLRLSLGIDVNLDSNFSIAFLGGNFSSSLSIRSCILEIYEI
jgi:hypothetical protein